MRICTIGELKPGAIGIIIKNVEYWQRNWIGKPFVVTGTGANFFEIGVFSPGVNWVTQSSMRNAEVEVFAPKSLVPFKDICVSSCKQFIGFYPNSDNSVVVKLDDFSTVDMNLFLVKRDLFFVRSLE